jgi:hypothetical protein
MFYIILNNVLLLFQIKKNKDNKDKNIFFKRQK